MFPFTFNLGCCSVPGCSFIGYFFSMLSRKGTTNNKSTVVIKRKYGRRAIEPDRIDLVIYDELSTRWKSCRQYTPLWSWRRKSRSVPRRLQTFPSLASWKIPSFLRTEVTGGSGEWVARSHRSCSELWSKVSIRIDCSRWNGISISRPTRLQGYKWLGPGWMRNRRPPFGRGWRVPERSRNANELPIHVDAPRRSKLLWIHDSFLACDSLRRALSLLAFSPLRFQRANRFCPRFLARLARLKFRRAFVSACD